MNARKDTLGASDAFALAATVNVIHSMRGKSITTIDQRREDASEETLRKLLVGPTGNLRAPTLRRGKTLLVGFNPAVFTDVLG